MLCVCVGSPGVESRGVKMRLGGEYSADSFSGGLRHNSHALNCFFPGHVAEESNSHTKGDRRA